MSDDQLKAYPIPSVKRLPLYLRFLHKLKAQQREVVSCTRIAESLDLVPVQVRKDLAMTGVVGRPKVGYEVPVLIDAIEDFLGWKNASDAFLVGAGSLGAALLGYEGFRDSGLNIVAAFDTNPKKIGTEIHGREVLPWEKFHDLVQRMHVHIGILAVPGEVAQDVTTEMVMAGIRAIWNFTPVKIEVPDNVIVEDVRLTASLAVLTSRLRQELGARS